MVDWAHSFLLDWGLNLDDLVWCYFLYFMGTVKRRLTNPDEKRDHKDDMRWYVSVCLPCPKGVLYRYSDINLYINILIIGGWFDFDFRDASDCPCFM